MERPGCSIPDAAETTPVREALLHSRSRRSSDRSGPNHGPRGGLVARSLAVEYARRGVRMNTEVTGESLTLTAVPRTLASIHVCRAEELRPAGGAPR
jgi:hypothetical protein